MEARGGGVNTDQEIRLVRVLQASAMYGDLGCRVASRAKRKHLGCSLSPSGRKTIVFGLRRNFHMKYAWVVILCVLGGFTAPVQAQEKTPKSTGNAALEKELYAVELKWMQAEHDKKMSGPDSMGEMWMDDFFDVLPGGRVVDKQEMMDMMGKADPKPGTGAFPVDFKIRAIYGNVVLATDHTTIKGLDANGKIVPVREMNVLRMFVKDKGKWRVAGAGLVPVAAP